MKLKYLALTCLLACTQAGAKPPRLGWENGWCWDNVVIQLLYNMRGVTECLLKNAGECRQKNRVLEKYIDLITAIRKNPDGYFIQEMRAYHAEWCNARGCTMCKWSFADSELAWFLKDYFFCCRDLFEMKIRGTEKKETETWSMFDNVAGKGNSVAKWIVEDPNLGIGHLRMENTPEYLLLNVNAGWKVIDEYIDLASRLSDELKKTHKTCPYELIGVGVQGSHVTAYIKDQWEDNPSWYYCDDMAALSLPAHQKIDTWPESGPWPGTHLSLLVYKRVDAGQDKPQGGAPVTPVVTDNGELEKLVQAFSLLRSLGAT